MQLSAPEVLDISSETAATRTLYGLDEKPTEVFGRNCLAARRMLERGVRFVQVWSGAGGASGNWDNHGNISTELPAIATSNRQAGRCPDTGPQGPRPVRRHAAGLEQRSSGGIRSARVRPGRDHNGGTFVTWLAGAGIKPGVAFGESDEWSWKARTPIYSYDLHATILHLLGIDHTPADVPQNGSDRRLTERCTGT